MVELSRQWLKANEPQPIQRVNAIDKLPGQDKPRPRLYNPPKQNPVPPPAAPAQKTTPRVMPMSYFSGLAAAALTCGVLYLWRSLYPVGDPALLLLVVIALLIWRGTYRRAVARRVTWRRAILRRDSWLFDLFHGRLLAHFAGIGAAIAAVVTLADFALTASVNEGLVAMALCLTTGVVLAFFTRWATVHTHRDLVLVVAAPLTAGLMGLVGTGLLFYLGWYVEPAPAEADAASLADGVAQAQLVLPARDHFVAWLLGVPRSLETAGWVFAKQSQTFAFSPLGLILLLLYNALVSFSLTRFVVDTVTSAYEPKDP